MNNGGQIQQFRAYDQPGTLGRIDVYFKANLALHQFQLDDSSLLGETIGIAYREDRPVLQRCEYLGGSRLFCSANEYQMSGFLILGLFRGMNDKRAVPDCLA